MDKPIWTKSASAKNNGDFISISAYSGYSLAMTDPQAEEYFLPPDVSDEELGKAIKASLQQSRSLSIEEDNEMYANVSQNYKDWIQKLMTLYGYKTKRALFKKMKNCSIDFKDDIILIRPTYHEKLEAWDGGNFTEEDYVKVPADSPPADIGVALRLAFSRCTGLGA